MSSIIRIEKTNDYTVMSNFHLKENKMSLKAKGLMSVMLSLPENWDYSIAGLVAICKEEETAIKSALKELKEFGYLTIKKLYPETAEDGTVIRQYVQYEYTVHERPIKNQGVENLPVENQPVENPGQLNTNKSNTNKGNKSNTKVLLPSNDQSKQFLNQTPRQKNLNLYDKCINLIDSFTQDKNLRQQLISFLNLRIEMKKGGILYANQWKGILDKLKSLCDTPEGLDVNKAILVVDRSIQKGWNGFYPLPEYNNSDNTSNRDIPKPRWQMSDTELSSKLAKDSNGNELKY